MTSSPQPCQWSPQSAGLRQDEDGVWSAPSTQALSYPRYGNAQCFQVEDSSFWFAHRNRCIVATMLRLRPAGLVVDVGAGNGFVARGLTDAGIETVVVEPGVDGARNAVQRGLRTVVRATFEEAGFAPQSLGGIGAFDVVEHIEDDVSFLRSLGERLQPSGRLYLTVPAFSWLWSDEDHFAGHFRRYSPRLLRDTLSQAGLTVEYLTAMFAWLPLPVFLARTLPSRMRRRAPPSERLAVEHSLPSGAVGSAFRALLDAEASAIARGARLPTGSSLLAVARKANA